MHSYPSVEGGAAVCCTGRDKVEMLLSMGASRMEGTKDVVQRAVKMAMTPLLNQMSVVGVVSIPGMMTGGSLRAVRALFSVCAQPRNSGGGQSVGKVQALTYWGKIM